MNRQQDDLIKLFLRPSEIQRITLSVVVANRTSSARDYPGGYVGWLDDDVEGLQDGRRFLSIVTHGAGESEQGSFFIFKLNSGNNKLEVRKTYPIAADVILGVAQETRHSLNSWPPSSPPGTPGSSAFTLTIQRDSGDMQPETFITTDVETLQAFSAEYRRLKSIATTQNLGARTHYSWLQHYSSDWVTLQSKAHDLRVKSIPLHERLSPAIAGLPGNDSTDIASVRDEWIRKAATAKASRGDPKRLRVRVGSFNVNGKSPSQDLSPWLRSAMHHLSTERSWISPLKPLSPLELLSDPLFGEEDGQDSARPESPVHSLIDVDLQEGREPDIFVLAFQEVDLSTEALLYTTSSAKEDMWLTAVFAALGEKGVLYEKLVSTQLVGMLLIVIVRKALSSCFSDVRSCAAGAGIMGFMGNKGATAIRLQFVPSAPTDASLSSTRPIALTFVNSHLAAFDDMVERRNSDFHDLSTRLSFASTRSTGFDDAFGIYQCDALFWMGGELGLLLVLIWLNTYLGGIVHASDLNYRIDLSDTDIRAMLASSKDGDDSVQYLVAYDQLRNAMLARKAFSGFVEHPITYLPTYRRKPAWTDRILHFPSPDIKLSQLRYRSHPEITFSDHQPVSADFDISLPLIDREEYEKHARKLHRELSGFEESGKMPRIKLRATSIDFGQVFYKRLSHRKFVLVPCVFRFVGTAPHQPVSPRWLHIEPVVGLLQPKETATINAIAYVDDDIASELNLLPPQLETTLILHTALGKDHFISVNGDYQYTCFANTLERLARLPGPIRTLRDPGDILPRGQALNAPREIMRLINWMMTNAPEASAAAFGYQAEDKLCTIVRECLDTGDDFPSITEGEERRRLSVAVAATLVGLLNSMVDPVVPPHLHARCMQVRDKVEAFEFLDEFPRESINIWISLTAFLHYIGKGADDQCAPPSRARRLAILFAPILLRDDPSGSIPRVSPIGKRDFLLHFIN
ncbi:hypothetical protein ID866_2066 [Astraeus odoratus]|nr:hypothetical protein ID866_2066 [Astraeus odoratus]